MAPPKRKLDFLGDCNTYGVAIPDFEAQFCHRCSQPECTRSQHGKSHFDQRVSTWYERLFANVPQLRKTDPRFDHISAKNFKMIDIGPVPTISSGWGDAPQMPVGMSLVTPPTPATEEEAAPDTDPNPAPEAPTEPQPSTPSVPAPASPLATVPPPAAAPKHVLLMNTPNQTGGKMLQGAPAVLPASPPRRDAWEAPAPVNPNEKVVKPGARIKLGGG